MDQMRLIIARLEALYPEAVTELEFGNAYQLLVAVVLSAQTTDRAVNRVTRVLFASIQSPEEAIGLGEARIASMIQSIGLWRSKAKYLVALSQQLIERHQGQVPMDHAALCALPGVGRKTASVVLSELMGLPYVAVDTHVFRVCRRTTLAPGKNVAEVDRVLHERYSPEERRVLHARLVLHGRYVCRARQAQCEGCGLKDLCPKIGVH